MAAPTTASPPSGTSKPAVSPSPTASTASSLHSMPDAPALPPPVLHQSGAHGVQAAAEALLKPRKPTMTSRLSSMFGSSKDPAAKAQANGDIVKAARVANGVDTANGRPPPVRQGSVSRPTKEPVTYKRFWVQEDGGHEHHLKVAKRQEKLSDMFQNLMLGKKKEDNPADQPLSLMSNWVDVMRNEKEKLAEAKHSPNNLPQTLVQKYGKCQEVVGRGAFGIVRVAHKQDPKDSRREQLYAVKEFKQRPNESAKKYQKRLTSEFCISSSMQHPNVITTLDLLQDEKGVYCEVMEYCSGGDLYTLVLAAGQLEVAEADCFFKQLMRGVEYMHEMGVAHRDLKPENLLLTTHGSIKITDFGNGECFRMAWEKEAHMTAGLCGSAPYIAPEEYVDKEFDPRAVDVWACGIIYMALRTGRHLWRVAQKGEDEFFDRYLEDRKEEEGYRPIEVLRRRQCRNVIYSILDPIPARRLTAHQVLASEWVSEIKVCHAGNEGF
ncbi:serine/threonine-protein kinase HAL4/sat4 [Ascochyta rabiei]|uniref:non-specific serine/threonine protein kinase n=1 Tax=Didymella rabiei TaxID=5454 RepID=A0A162X7L0_DIDRA|nr:serine/threonine-protein kinase HAL4/sat4 [Ascochyta rabiei]KZM19384.1 ATP binding [Ascochyta rabiei]UPX12418.1 serine/threonine-protein kinase HAL4/sat4 [Ascochyta rabiei]